jgi:hypothetical protein
VRELTQSRTFSLEEALKAQKALRTAAGLGHEAFPVQAFVGMISDEIEALRKAGRTDDDIVALIQDSSDIRLSADELRDHYASPGERHSHGSGRK